MGHLLKTFILTFVLSEYIISQENTLNPVFFKLSLFVAPLQRHSTPIDPALANIL